MAFTVSGMVISARLEQLENALSPKPVRLSLSFTLVSFEQFLKAEEPMKVTLLGIVIEVRL